MKLLPRSDFCQVFSQLSERGPATVWAIDLETESVSGDLLDRCTESSTGWVGWGFRIAGTFASITNSCILFEHREDAVMAKLIYGNGLYAN
jgi:hypothetical protein